MLETALTLLQVRYRMTPQQPLQCLHECHSKLESHRLAHVHWCWAPCRSRLALALTRKLPPLRLATGRMGAVPQPFSLPSSSVQQLFMMAPVATSAESCQMVPAVLFACAEPRRSVIWFM